MTAASIAPPRRRGPRLVARVVEAALAEIARVGVEELSIEDVAALAGVNKTTIYRRWGGPEALALYAIAQRSDLDPLADTGDLREDLIGYARRFRDVCRSPAMLSTVRLRISSTSNEGIAAEVRRRAAHGDEQVLNMFRRAAKRGQLPDTADLRLTRDLLIGGLHYLLLFREEPVGDDVLAQLVDTVLSGARQSRSSVGGDRESG